jgi:1,4-dihydroxy-2-naphthoate octaprenyltransferase
MFNNKNNEINKKQNERESFLKELNNIKTVFEMIFYYQLLTLSIILLTISTNTISKLLAIIGSIAGFGGFVYTAYIGKKKEIEKEIEYSEYLKQIKGSFYNNMFLLILLVFVAGFLIIAKDFNKLAIVFGILLLVYSFFWYRALNKLLKYTEELLNKIQTNKQNEGIEEE